VTTAEILRKAADLIEPEGKWTQGYYARNSSGDIRVATDSEAVCWCAIGAIRKVSHTTASREAIVVAQMLGFKGSDELVNWNDAKGRTQAEVVAALRAAADAQEAQL